MSPCTCSMWCLLYSIAGAKNWLVDRTMKTESSYATERFRQKSASYGAG